jgi:hypothetical protein
MGVIRRLSKNIRAGRIYSMTPHFKSEELMIAEQGKSLPIASDRIRGLETRLMTIEATLKGLNEEIHDLRSWVTKYNTAERPILLPTGGSSVPVAVSAEAVVSVKQAETPAARAEMELIMQPDGTLKPEKRASSRFIIK